MKVIRRRRLFYDQRRSNLYRIFGLLLVILIAGWVVLRLSTGTLRSPFAATMTPTRSSQSLTMEGQTFFDAGNLSSAITAYQAAAGVDPTDATVLAQLARIQAYSSRLLTTDPERLTRLTDAQKSIDQAAVLAPNDSTVHAIRAFVYDWLADPALDSLRAAGDKNAAALMVQAEQEGLLAISQDPRNALALAFYAEILIDEQKWDQASQNIQQALSLDPNTMDVHRVYAYLLESTGYYNDAITEYQNALKFSPNLTFLYISIGRNYRELAIKSTSDSEQSQLYDAALQNFSQAVAINQTLGIQDTIPYTEIAKTYSQLGQFYPAELNALKALSFDPTNADLYGRLGIIYDKARNYESVIPAMQCVVSGCTPEISCQARFATSCQGSEGVTVKPLPLTANSDVYYYTYGTVLAALSPIHPEYCKTAIQVLDQVQAAYGTDPNVAAIVADGLAICASVATQQAQTPTLGATPTLVPTPRFTPVFGTQAPHTSIDTPNYIP